MRIVVQLSIVLLYILRIVPNTIYCVFFGIQKIISTMQKTL